jgi:hypothetical protein
MDLLLLPHGADFLITLALSFLNQFVFADLLPVEIFFVDFFF